MSIFIKGVINLRGKVIPIMDVRLRFNMAERAYDERTCIIVVDINTTAIGLVVDEAREVIDIPEAQVEPSPQAGMAQASHFLKGRGKIDDEVKILLNAEHLLHDEELQQIENNLDTD